MSALFQKAMIASAFLWIFGLTCFLIWKFFFISMIGVESVGWVAIGLLLPALLIATRWYLDGVAYPTRKKASGLLGAIFFLTHLPADLILIYFLAPFLLDFFLETQGILIYSIFLFGPILWEFTAQKLARLRMKPNPIK